MKQDKRGQDLVEFALTLPLLMLFVLGMFDFGRAIIAYSVLRNGTREGARYAAVHLNDETGVNDAITKRVMAIDPSKLGILYKGWCIQEPDYQDAVVKVCAVYQFDPVLKGIFGTITLRSLSTMRMEQFPAEFSTPTTASCPAIPAGCQ